MPFGQSCERARSEGSLLCLPWLRLLVFYVVGHIVGQAALFIYGNLEKPAEIIRPDFRPALQPAPETLFQAEA